MKRAGFTMIELIFVIVILGILAAVAVPKLAATRTDAGVSKVSSNLQTLIKDVGAFAVSNGTLAATDTWGDMTSVQISSTAGGAATGSGVAIGTAVFVSAGEGGATDGCFSVQMSNLADANLSVTALAAGSGAVCVGAKALALKNNLGAADGTAKVHSFATQGVTY